MTVFDALIDVHAWLTVKEGQTNPVTQYGRLRNVDETYFDIIAA